MVGNDIIDLSWARKESDWRREGFLQKVFTLNEQKLIHDSGDPFRFVWRLWSMKESAYKLFLQTGKDRFLNPLRLRCEINSLVEGSVRIGKLNIFTYSTLHPEYIFTRACRDNKNESEDRIFLLSKTDTHFQSHFTHRQLLLYMARKLNLSVNRITIVKTDQYVPEVFYDGEKLNVSVSLTHHGHYGAYSVY